ncbi:hypothetical protein Tco_0993818 [Tanacetum coccineum]|uniref:Uncharacterized protein n=1 Tax=Tanacetum coccineum TaxID=301880 RepID=A0ABQ5I2X8_9ASTR
MDGEYLGRDQREEDGKGIHMEWGLIGGEGRRVMDGLMWKERFRRRGSGEGLNGWKGKNRNMGEIFRGGRGEIPGGRRNHRGGGQEGGKGGRKPDGMDWVREEDNWIEPWDMDEKQYAGNGGEGGLILEEKGERGGKRIRIWERGGTEGGGGELGRKEPSSPFKRRKEGGKTESGGKKEKGRGKEIGGPRGGGRRNGIARRSKRGKGRRPMEGESQIDGGLYVFGKLLEGGSLEIHSGRNHSERGEVAKEEGKEYHLKLILKDHLWWRKNGVSGKITVRVGLGLWERGKKKKGNGEGGGENGKGTNFGMDGGGGKREWKLLSFLPHWGIHAQEGGLDTLSKGREGGKKELSEDKLKEG